MTRLPTLLLLVLSLFLSLRTEATDRFFDDIKAVSPSGRNVVTATSPENKSENEIPAVQANFIYTCTDTISNTI